MKISRRETEREMQFHTQYILPFSLVTMVVLLELQALYL